MNRRIHVKLATKFKIATVMFIAMLGCAVAAMILRSSPEALLQPCPQLLQSHPTVGVTLRPGVRDCMRMATVGPRSSRSLPAVDIQDDLERRRQVPFHVSTNSLGFRGPEISQDPAPGVTRIACVGDSVTYGYGVDNGEDFCSLLQERLPGKVETINVGIPGQSSGMMLEYLRAKVLPLRPHIVIISVGINDIAFLRAPNRAAMRPGPEQNMHDVLKAQLEQFESNLRMAVALLRQHKIRPVLLTPITASFFEYSAIHQISAITRQLGQAAKAQVVDLNGLLLDKEKENGVVLERAGASQKIIRYKDSRPEVLISARAMPDTDHGYAAEIVRYLHDHIVVQQLFLDDCHPSRAGHSLVAHGLAAALQAAAQ